MAWALCRKERGRKDIAGTVKVISSASTPSTNSLHLGDTVHLLAFSLRIRNIYHSKYLHSIVFWDTRIAASRLSHSQTRLPDIPDQTRFIKQWFDWHRGYTMVDNDHGVQHRRNLRRESLSDVAPGQLPRDQYGQTTLATDDQDEVLGHPTITVTRSSRDSRPLDEPHIDPEDRLFDSAPQSPQISTMDSSPSNEGRYITEEDSMPPTFREASPFLRSPNPFVASAAAPNTNASLGDLRAVLADTSQREAETIRAEQEARNRLHDASIEVQQAAERLDITRRVSRNTRRRIQEFENANRLFGTREQVESQGDDYVSPISAMFERYGNSSAAQRGAAGPSATSSTSQTARSHSHPSRRDESRTDESSPSSRSSSMFSSAYLGPQNPRMSELAPSALVRERVRAASSSIAGLVRLEQENLIPSYGSSSNSRQAVQTSSRRHPPVFGNLTNAVERPSSRAPRHEPSSDNRSFPRRRRPRESRSGNMLEPPDDWEPRLYEYDPRLIEFNTWNPHSSDLEPSVGYANANPFGSRSSDNQRSSPFMPGARASDGSGISMLPGTHGQNIIAIRPPPKTKAEMTVEIECRICMEQPANVACLPCGKLDDCGFPDVASLTMCRPLRDVQMVLRYPRAE